MALPALEALHKAWSTRYSRTQYADFQDGLNAGIDKIVDYYDRSADSDAYIMAMCMIYSTNDSDIYSLLI